VRKPRAPAIDEAPRSIFKPDRRREAARLVRRWHGRINFESLARPGGALREPERRLVNRQICLTERPTQDCVLAEETLDRRLLSSRPVDAPSIPFGRRMLSRRHCRSAGRTRAMERAG
jgi:hypothetical protein